MAQPYVRTNFGTVNSTAQKAANGGVIEHSKFGINPLPQVQVMRHAVSRAYLKRRSELPRVCPLYCSLSGEAYALRPSFKRGRYVQSTFGSRRNARSDD